MIAPILLKLEHLQCLDVDAVETNQEHKYINTKEYTNDYAEWKERWGRSPEAMYYLQIV
jgi:hypothetical protein